MSYSAFNPIQHGWWPSARRVLSPNCNQRPADSVVSLLVVHNISLPPGKYGGGHVERFFTNQLDAREHSYFKEIAHLQVSAHCFIDRKGNTTQFVPFHLRAWHAGRSRHAGVEECNDYGIGIELEGVDDKAYTAQQYQMLVRLSRDLVRAYPAITPERIVGHSDIAPGRKTDPGPAFDWVLYHELLTKALAVDAKEGGA